MQPGAVRDLPGVPQIVESPSRDPLTGLVDGKFIGERLELLLAASTAPVSAVLIDIDQFSELNRRFGREVGGRILHAAASALELRVRGTDCVARTGGAQFTVLLPDTGLTAAAAVAQRLRWIVSGLGVDEIRVRWPVTASVGAASTETVGREADPLLSAAERALNQAKRSGPDRVAVFRSPMVAPLLLPGPEPLRCLETAQARRDPTAR